MLASAGFLAVTMRAEPVPTREPLDVLSTRIVVLARPACT